jgi:hypothetical protein
MLKLPDVTLVLIETREHALAHLALLECQRKVEFGDVLVFTDQPAQFMRADRRIITVPDWPDKVGWSRCFWYEVPLHVRTSHILGIQWDSWVVEPGMWQDEYLHYDFIGAPWWYKDGMNVGNGGFSLRSTKFARFIRKNRAQFPCITALDDDLYCRKYRPSLQEAGFVWAPEPLAADFAFECVQLAGDKKTFGFHAAFNFGKVLGNDSLMERANLMAASSYITESTHIWKSFAQHNPEVTQSVRAV